MRRSKFTEEQIVMALRQAEAGTAVADICRKLGISQATFFSVEEELWQSGHTGAERVAAAA